MSTIPQPDPQNPQHHSFCQICGRAVASDADRMAGNAYPCGLCNEVKLASPASTGYVYPGPDAGAGAGPAGVPPVGAPPPFAGGIPGADVPNPGLAALLGLIPGVGAMYNGQYAKGIVHLVVFAVLCSLVDANGIFILFVFGWVAYQSIEAHHTARARRDGTPLPNPFNLNDIGDKLGFGKAWPSYSASAGSTTVDPAAGGAPYTPPVAGATYQPPVSNWGAPWESSRPAPGFDANFNTQQQYPPVPPIPPVPPYSPVDQGFGQGLGGPGYSPYDPMPMGVQPPFPAPRHRFPAGAIWLIALGTLFLLNTSGIFRGLNFRLLLPLLFIGLGIWSFVWRMTSGGFGLADDGSPGYRIRAFRALRGSVWLILLGVIFFLADFNILPWSRSWPLFLILAGVMTFLERAVMSSAAPLPYPYPPAPMPTAAPGPVPSGTSDASNTTQNQEGR